MTWFNTEPTPSWYKVHIRVPLIAVSGRFNAKGFVAQLFPVEGSGRVYGYYKQVSIVAKLAVIEPLDNTTSLQLADEDSILADDVTFEEVALSVTQWRDDGDMETLDGGGGDKDSKSFQVGSVLFWKVARETGRELARLLPGCLSERFKEAQMGEVRSKKRSSRERRRL